MTTDQAVSRQASHENRSGHLIAELVDALELFIAQWSACGPNSDFGRYFENVRLVAEVAIEKAKDQS